MGENDKENNLSKTVKVIIAILLVAVLGVGLYFLINARMNATMEVSASEFTQLVEDPRASANGDAGKIPDNEQIVKVHVKDFARTSSNAGHFVNLLEGSIDWCKVKAALDAIGYQGYLTAEVDTFHRTPEYQYEITKMALDHIISL